MGTNQRQQIVMTDEEIAAGLNAGVLMFNVESEAEGKFYAVASSLTGAMREAQRAGLPMVMANARLSERIHEDRDQGRGVQAVPELPQRLRKAVVDKHAP